jgi:cob(I)alamin adenosyltransferase
VQHDLFDLGGEVCIPGMEMITAKQVQHLEDELDRFNDDLEPLKDFILPGGTRAAALCHQARTICRRAERMIVALGQEEAVNDAPRQYLNRLSDLLFVLGRVLNRAGGRATCCGRSARTPERCCRSGYGATVGPASAGQHPPNQERSSI